MENVYEEIKIEGAHSWCQADANYYCGIHKKYLCAKCKEQLHYNTEEGNTYLLCTFEEVQESLDKFKDKLRFLKHSIFDNHLQEYLDQGISDEIQVYGQDFKDFQSEILDIYNKKDIHQLSKIKSKIDSKRTGLTKSKANITTLILLQDLQIMDKVNQDQITLKKIQIEQDKKLKKVVKTYEKKIDDLSKTIYKLSGKNSALNTHKNQLEITILQKDQESQELRETMQKNDVGHERDKEKYENIIKHGEEVLHQYMQANEELTKNYNELKLKIEQMELKYDKQPDRSLDNFQEVHEEEKESAEIEPMDHSTFQQIGKGSKVRLLKRSLYFDDYTNFEKFAQEGMKLQGTNKTRIPGSINIRIDRVNLEEDENLKFMIQNCVPLKGTELRVNWAQDHLILPFNFYKDAFLKAFQNLHGLLALRGFIINSQDLGMLIQSCRNCRTLLMIDFVIEGKGEIDLGLHQYHIKTLGFEGTGELNEWAGVNLQLENILKSISNSSLVNSLEKINLTNGGIDHLTANTLGRRFGFKIGIIEAQ